MWCGKIKLLLLKIQSLPLWSISHMENWIHDLCCSTFSYQMSYLYSDVTVFVFKAYYIRTITVNHHSGTVGWLSKVPLNTFSTISFFFIHLLTISRTSEHLYSLLCTFLTSLPEIATVRIIDGLLWLFITLWNYFRNDIIEHEVYTTQAIKLWPQR